jgi:hypothetical protein
MQRGYQIVEPTSLGLLIGNPSQAAVAVAILVWTIDRIKAQSPELFDGVEVKVIPATYLGTYPAIGVSYDHYITNDVGSMLAVAIDAFVGRVSFSDFLSFVDKSNVNWCETWQQLKKRAQTR